MISGNLISRVPKLIRPLPIEVLYRLLHNYTNLDYDVNKFTLRTHTCGQIVKKDIGKQVKLCGWLQYSRFNNKILLLRDSYGIAQCVIDDRTIDYQSLRRTSINNESVLQIVGTVRERPENQKSTKIQTGELEVIAHEVQILSSSKSNLPILSRDNSISDSSTNLNRLKYRYLDLRSRRMQSALRFRSQTCQKLREKLLSFGFVECETPTLLNRTPGGANEFVVPTQTRDRFYNLVQSPQQLKQLLMIGGLDRYFQICRCYRDEPSRSDRQPEFTQVDIELSFTSQNHVMRLIDDLLYYLFTNVTEEFKFIDTSSFDEDRNLPRISFKEAFKLYGTDKPDTRFGWTIQDDQDGNLYLEIPHHIECKQLSDLIEASIVVDRAESSLKYETCTQNGRTEVKFLDNSDLSRKILGALRLSIAGYLSENGNQIYDMKHSLLWVTEFPLFVKNSCGKWESNHHPFTAPTDETRQMLQVDPGQVIGQHYDLILNGQEIAGGSIRIHDGDMQSSIFKDILEVDEDVFGYFIEALRSGCPPHGGIAIGLDRLIAALMEKDTIRDVMAFPKSSGGRDMMTGCPEEISLAIKKLYHLR